MQEGRLTDTRRRRTRAHALAACLALVRAALEQGCWAAHEVVEQTGLTRWVVDRVLARMVDGGPVEVSKEVRGTGGQPRKPYRLRHTRAP